MNDSADNTAVKLEHPAAQGRPQAGPATRNALEQVQNAVLEALRQALGRVLERADDTLFERAERAGAQDDHNQYFGAMRALRRSRGLIETTFAGLITRNFRQGYNQGTAQRELHGQEAGRDEDTLALSTLVNKVRGNCENVLPTFDRRIGFLIGDMDLQQKQNPVGPEAVCDAFKAAMGHLDAPLVIRLMIYKLFDQHLASRLPGLYAQIDRALANFGVLPGIGFCLTPGQARRRAPERAKGGAGRKPVQPFLDLAAQTPAQADRRTPSPRQTAGAANALDDSMPMAPGIEPSSIDGPVLPLVDDVPMAAGIIPETGRRLSSPVDDDEPAAAGLLDAAIDKALDLCSVPMAPGIVTSGAKIPVSRQADGHEQARRRGAGDAPTQAGAAPRKPFSLDDVPRESPMAGAGDSRSAQAARRRVQLAHAQAHTLEEIESRVEETPGLDFIKVFVAEHWKNLLFITCAREGRNSKAWREATATLDDLIWSVKPKTSADQRRRLAEIQPALLANLRLGMQRLAIDPQQRDAFIARLQAIHSRLLGAESIDDAPANEDNTPAAAATTPNDSPMHTEVPDMSPMPTAKVRKKSAVRPVRRAEGIDPCTFAAGRLKIGDRVVIYCSDGTIKRAKLAWEIPVTKTLLFTDEHGLQAGHYTRDEFAELLRYSRARVLS